MARTSFFFENWPLIGLSLGSAGQPVQALQHFLQRFGYLRAEPAISGHTGPPGANVMPVAQLGSFDQATERALREFQRRHALEPTGVLDPQTAATLVQPRCGVPDHPYGPKNEGDAWPIPPSPNLRYGFASFTQDLSQPEIEAALAVAFGVWSAATPLKFRLVPASETPEFLIGFAVGAHGDDTPFDGPGGIAGHGFFPPPPNTAIAGDVHFDDAESWTAGLPVPLGATDLVSIAMHEIGHALGLTHSTNKDAVMFPTVQPRRELGGDDVPRIQALYGSATQPPQPQPPQPQPPQPQPPQPQPPQPPVPAPVDPPNDPVVRQLIDEWIRQMDTCAKRVYPATYVDKWGRLCGRTPSTTLKCDLPPNQPPWDSYAYVWQHNDPPQFYPHRVRRYVELRLQGNSYSSLATCRT